MARILVVEDDADLRGLVVRRLKHAGHRVQDAENAAGAETVVAGKGVPDVVVLDVDMPGMDGFELLDLLRDRTGRPNLAAVFLSGRTEVRDIETGRDLGAVYLTKPFIANALVNAIETQLQLETPEEEW